jgi:hypothetical protein
MVGHPCPVLRRRLGGRRIESAIDLQGVAADDLSADDLRDPDRDPRLPGPGRAGDDQDAGQPRESDRPSIRSRARSRYSFTVCTR